MNPHSLALSASNAVAAMPPCCEVAIMRAVLALLHGFDEVEAKVQRKGRVNSARET